MKMLKGAAIGLGTLIVILVAAVAWCVSSTSAARWIAGVARDALDDKLDIGAVSGTIAGPLTLRNVRYLDRAAGIEFAAARIAFDVALADLLKATVRAERIEVDAVEVMLREVAQPPPQREQRPFSLEPPIDVRVDAFTLNRAVVRREREPLLDITRAAFAGQWTSDGIAIEHFDVRSPQGDVHFVGALNQQGGARTVYVGKGDGRFRWTVGERSYAGTLQAVADPQTALEVQMTSPLKARLALHMEQSAMLPWRFTLDVPRSDPREELMPDTSMRSLAASLQGHGSLREAVVRGLIVLNEETLHLERVRVARGESDLRIESVLRLGDDADEIRAAGSIDLARQPWSARFKADWRGIGIPAAWAGQELRTHGRLDLSGNTRAFAAEGAIGLGPPGRVAEVTLKMKGSPRSLNVDRFDIVQEEGGLSASARIELQPQLAWQAHARARHLDPGAFAAAWGGSLDFDLESEGRLADAGPQGSLHLTNLDGRLRERALFGAADLSLSAQRVLAGTLSLRSGSSTLGFRGKPGSALDATIALDIASLDDWVPDAGGSFSGRFAMRGNWPSLSVEGAARGNELNAAGVRIDTLAVNVDLANRGGPSGTARIDLTHLSAAGLQFDSVLAHASGSTDAHRLELRATGQPLAVDLAVQGARTPAGWSGSVQRLTLDVQEAARLTLREPARIVYAEDRIEVSSTCLADRDIRLCAAGSMQPDGAAQASYSMSGVPLALANVLAPADLPLKLAGTLEGEGEVRRTPQGALIGSARIGSPSGQISRQAVAGAGGASIEGAAAAQTLLSWNDLRIAASLSGSQARASLNARVQENGSLRGEVALQGFGEPAGGIRGNLEADLPDLTPLGVFTPQLVNVQGRVTAQADVTGTLQQPVIAARLDATGLAAEIPAVGLDLKNGRLRVTPAAQGEFTIAAAVDSGDGRLEADGTASTAGALNMSIRGRRFLATDIPGARVVAEPDLTFARTAERVSLSGEVRIPTANVNLQKLPRGNGAAQASADVVVVDDETVDEQTAAAVPLHANVTVILGEEVKLIGFGLEASVDGRLEVRERPGEPTRGSGQIGVSGIYQAYGQDLTIRQGRLLYAQTPLDNPRLNIVATRTVDEVTAGLRIAGSARSPELDVFSDPPMGQASALSYLVAGKPIEDLGSAEGEGDAVQTAARSLGTAAGGLLAKGIGRRLGVDEAGIEESEMIGGAALTVGEYLSPRLYLSYGIGLFEPGEVVTLRYELADELALQAQRGSQDTRAGIEYRVEK